MGRKEEEFYEEVCCMTAAVLNNVYIVGKLKDPNKKPQKVSAQQIAEASKKIDEIMRQK